MTDKILIEQKVSEPMTLRLLNGILNGCEFAITTERLLVVVSSSTDSELLSTSNELSADTILLPFAENGVNFEITCLLNKDRKILLRELYANESYEQYIELNRVVKVGATQFSVKLKNDEWSKEVINVKLNESPKKHLFLTFKKSFIGVYVLIVSIMMSIFIVGMMVYNSESNYIRRLAYLLSNKELIFAEGRDHFLYVIAENHEKGIWANQIVERGDFASHRVRVVNPEHEEERVYRWLADNYPHLKYFKIQFNQLLVPELWVSKKRSELTNDNILDLREKLKQYMPYVKDVDVKFMDDYQLINEAEQGLSSLGLKFKKIVNDDYYSYTITGELNDNELIRLKYFINDFYNQWGKEFIVFNLGLENDVLKNRTYSSGDTPYVKMGTLQWSFNEVKRDEEI